MNDNNNVENADTKLIISERMKKIILSSGKNQREFAKFCGVSPNIVSKAVRGDLSVDKALKICQQTGYSMDYIFGNSDFQTMESYAYNVLNSYISIDNINTTQISNRTEIKGCIKIGKALFSYFKGLCEANRSEMSEHIKEICRDEATENILNAIKNKTGTEKLEFDFEN